jgi:hypothetical protein
MYTIVVEVNPSFEECLCDIYLLVQFNSTYHVRFLRARPMKSTFSDFNRNLSRFCVGGSCSVDDATASAVRECGYGQFPTGIFVGLDECANDDVAPRVALLNHDVTSRKTDCVSQWDVAHRVGIHERWFQKDHFDRDRFVPPENKWGFAQAPGVVLRGWVSDVSIPKPH